MKKIMQVTTIIVMSLLVFSCALNAQDNVKFKNNDQQLLIVTDDRGCSKEVELISEVDNCEGTSFSGTCGLNGKDCVCMPTGKFLSWRTGNGSQFEIKFVNTNPFEKTCNFTQDDGLTIKSKNQRQIKCKTKGMEGEFEYDVILESCPDQVYDPRVVIRGHQ